MIDTLLGVAGLATGIISYIWSIRIKQPLFLVKTNNLIHGNISHISGLEVTFKGIRIANLFISKVLFYNCGAETLHKQDIVSSNPLRIVCPNNNFILDAVVVKSNNKSSSITVDVEDERSIAKISFEYLDQGHGGIIQIVHTGDSCKDLLIQGDLKGARLQIRKHNREVISNITDLLIALASSLLVLASFRFLEHLPRMTIFLTFVFTSIGIILLAPTFTRWVDHVLNPLPSSFRDFD